MIMGVHTPKHSILLPRHWRKVLPGFLTMLLSYFHQLLCPDSKLHERVHRAGPDTLTLIDTIRALIYLCHRDKELVQSTPNRSTQSNEKILYTLEQLRKGRNLNN